MIKVLYVIKDWETQGIPSYHSSLVPLLLKRYEGIIFAEGWQKCPEQLLSISHKLSKCKILGDVIKNKPDILIIFHYFGSPFVLPLLLISKFLRIKTIIVTDFTEIGLPRLHKSPLKNFRELMRYFLLLSQLFLVNRPVCYTRYEIKVLSKLSKLTSKRKKFKIIPIGNNFDVSTSEKRNYILTVSRWWSDRKNLHTILKVFSRIVKEINCKLIIVGKFTTGTYYIPNERRWESGKEYKQKIMELFKELNLDNYVEFVGVKIGKELQELFRKAKIFYLPSKNETFGMVYVEAMASRNTNSCYEEFSSSICCYGWSYRIFKEHRRRAERSYFKAFDRREIVQGDAEELFKRSREIQVGECDKGMGKVNRRTR